MFGVNRWDSFDEIFNVQREVDRLFQQFWSDLPARTAAAGQASALKVNAGADGWQIDVPMPGIDPQHVTLEVAGNTLHIRAEVPPEGQDRRTARFEQSFTIPPFLDVDRVTASHRHGILRLDLPLKESVKPRRVEIQSTEQKQLTTA